MNRYAFIDVPNSNGTTLNCHGFSIDYGRLYELLTNNKWNCNSIYYYKGYKGEKEKKQLEKIKKIGYIVQTKLTHIHPDRNETLSVYCRKCQITFDHNHFIKGSRKSNCDVELTVDVLETVKDGNEIMLFTGDGDFSYLIRKVINKNVKVIIVSSKTLDNNGIIRFSTRLSDILKEEERSDNPKVRFIHIDNWKKMIQKENRHEA